MRINQHIPFNARRDLAAPFGRLHTRLTDRLQRIDDVVLTVSARPIRAQDLGPGALAINYHTRFGRRGNLNLKLNYLPGFLYADRSGFSGWSEVALRPFDPGTIDSAQAERFLTRRIERRILASGLSKEPQTRSGAAVHLPKGYILFTLQQPRDVVLKLADVSTDAILSLLIARAGLQPFVIKLHPATRDPGFINRINALNNPARGVFVVNDHVHDLILGASRVVTVNSGTGLEALLLERPVITCGRSDYHHLTMRATTPEALTAALDASPAIPDRVTLARYAFWYFKQMIDVSEAGWEDLVVDRLLAAGRPATN